MSVIRAKAQLIKREEAIKNKIDELSTELKQVQAAIVALGGNEELPAFLKEKSA